MQNTPLDPLLTSLFQNRHKPIQLSYPFIAHHKRQFLSSVSDIDSLPIFKKSKIQKLNLHQLQIEAEDLAQQNSQQIQHQQIIIQSLRHNQSHQSHHSNQSIPKSALNTNIKPTYQQNNKRSPQIRSASSSLFIDGFLPDVKKFYNTFKHLDRQKQRQKLFRNTVHHSESAKQTVNTLKLAQNIQQNQIFPKKLGMVGRSSCHQLNQNNVHMTKRQMKAFAQGMALMDFNKLGLSNNKLTKQNARLLFQNVPSKLEKINLKNTIKSKDILTCLNSQKLKTGNLKKLNLSDNRITDTGLLCIEQVLTTNVNLQILNLSQNLITDQSCESLANLIDKNLNLRNLNFSWNQISGKKVFFLFDAMSTSSSLLNVNLSRNKIGTFLNEAIPKKMFTKIKLQNETKQKGQAGGFSSLESVCEFLKNNKYLLHLDLSFNSIKSEDCEIIAQAFNIFNECLVGLHFEGNSNYITNYLGYLIERPDAQEDHVVDKEFHQDQAINAKENQTQQKSNTQILENPMKRGLFNRIDFNSLDEKQENLLLKEKKSLIKSKHSIYGKHKNGQNRSIHASECWICHGWITQTFTFQITKSKLQALQSFKMQRNHESEESHTVNVYIHLENYNYQPLLMRIHKNPKKAFKNMTLGQQKNSKINKAETKIKNFHDGDLKKKPLDSINSITFCDGLFANTFKHIDSEEEEYIFYNIMVKIPQNQKIKYFFTIHGEVFLNDESQKIAVDSKKREIRFETFNPFRKGLIKKFQFVQKKWKSKQQFKELSEKIKQLVVKLPSSMQISVQNRPPSTYCLMLNEVNLYTPQHDNTQDKQHAIQNQMKFHAIYKKLIQEKQQLTGQDYDLLIDQRAIIIDKKEEGSQKYISSDKLIEENQLMNSAGVNQNQFIFLKPRNKAFFFGHSDPKSSKIDLPENFSFLIFYLDKLRKYQNPKDSSQLLKIIDKTHKELTNPNTDSEKYSSEPLFYPAKIQLSSKNLFLTICQSAKTYYQKKIQLNNFTGQISKIGHFDKDQLLDKSHKSFHQDQNLQNHKQMANQASKIKIAKVSTYVLIKYSMLKEDDGQNQNDTLDIYQRLSERKKTQKSQKMNKKNGSKSRIQYDKNTPITSEYKINIMKAERKDDPTDQNKNVSQKNQNPNNSLLKTQELQLDLQQIGSESNISTISMRLVEEILFPLNNQNTQQAGQLRTSIEKREQEKNEGERIFIQKIKNWKGYNHWMDFDFQEKTVLKLVGQQIISNLQQKIKRSKSAKKIPTKKTNKFNIKINKFCSLQSNSYTGDELNFTNLLEQKKKLRFNLEQKKVLFQTGPNDDLLNIGNSQNGFDFDSPVRQSNSKNMDVNKMKRLQDKLNGINIGKQIQVFLHFDNLFDQQFMEFSLDESIDTYINKINKIIKKSSITQGKKDNIKSKSSNPNIWSNQQTSKSLKKGTSKSILRRTLRIEDNKSFILNGSQKNINKNILMFLADEKKRQHLYFSNPTKPQSFPFNDTVRQNVKLCITERILNRFEYVNINLIKNLTKGHLKYVFPSGAKEILLKELCIYRSFLFNSPNRDYKEFINKLIDTAKNDNLQLQSINPEFMIKVKRFSFGKILDLLQEHLLYTIFFLTKHTAFIIFANRYKKSSKRDSSTHKSSQKKIIQNIIKQNIPIKPQAKLGQKSTQIKKYSQNKRASFKLNDLTLSKTKQNQSLISYMKNQPQKFAEELKNQMKSIITQILSIMTKLHSKYDLDLERQKCQSISLRSSKKKTIKLAKKDSERMGQRGKTESLFSQISSKNISGEKSRSKKKKKTTLVIKNEVDSSTKNIKLKTKTKKLSILRRKEDGL